MTALGVAGQEGTPAIPLTSGSRGRFANPLPATMRRPMVHGLVFAGLLFLVYLFAVSATQVRTFGYDAYAYWSVNPANPYTVVHGNFDSFVYAPIVAQAFSLASVLPWWQFLWLWTALLVGTLLWLGGRKWLFLLAFPPVAVELYYGNIHILLAAAIVLGFDYPWTWAFVLLTKVTPGVGLLWFAARKEWRNLAIALGATAAIVLIGVVISPGIWRDWFLLLSEGPESSIPNGGVAIPFWVRLPIAALIVVWGARTNRRWTVPVACMVALPVLWLTTSLAMLAALPRLTRRPAGERPDAVEPTTPPSLPAPAAA